MESNKTRRFEPSPCVMFVGLGEREGQACADILHSLPGAKSLQIMRVAHIRAACERMLVTRPLIVAFSELLPQEDRKVLTERAQDIMAEIVTVPQAFDPSGIGRALAVAVRVASVK